MVWYCTYTDSNFLPRVLALYSSLRLHSPPFRLWVLCLDRETEAALQRFGLPDVLTIALTDLEQADAQLVAVKAARRPVEYYFTCTPALMKFILASRAEVDLLTYLDADLFFFNDPAPVFAELGNGSVALVPQRFAIAGRKELCGEYNVGWVTVRRDTTGMSALDWWRARCLESCATDDPLSGVYGDQKYLDSLPALFPRVVVIRHPGANLAPWNIGTADVSVSEGRVMVDGRPLLWFHFSDFEFLGWWLHPHYGEHAGVPGRVLKSHVLRHYGNVLRQLESLLAADRDQHPVAAVSVAKFAHRTSYGARLTRVLKWKRAVFLPLSRRPATTEVSLLTEAMKADTGEAGARRELA